MFGVSEGANEDTDQLVLTLFKEKLKIDLPVERLSRTHRVERQWPQSMDGTQRWRPIIVQFISYGDRRAVFGNKRLLKESGITLREDVTAKCIEV